MAVQKYKTSRFRRYYNTARPYIKAGAAAAGAYAYNRYRSNPMQLVKDVSYLKSVLNVERKYLDASFTMTPDNTSSSGGTHIVLLNGMVAGTGSSNVVGRSVRNKTLQVKCGLNINASAPNATRVKLVLVYDRYPQGTGGLQWTDLYNDSNVNSLRNWTTKERFRILGQRLINLDVYDDYEKNVSFYVKFRGAISHTKWNAPPNATIGAIERGAMYILAMSDEATYTPTVVGRMRLTWVDN